jgi:hypothetical protein
MPSVDPKTFLTIGHLLGLVVGLGGVALLDIYLLRFMRGARIESADVDFVHFVSRLVAVGLALLWASGFGFLMLDAARGGAALANPKLHAKLLIVLVLTGNGILLHARVLPLFGRQVGRGLFEALTRRERALVIASGAVSAASWYTPFLLGAVRELNGAAPASTFIAGYAALVLAAAAGLMLATHGARAATGGAARAFPDAEGSRWTAGLGLPRELSTNGSSNYPAVVAASGFPEGLAREEPVGAG